MFKTCSCKNFNMFFVPSTLKYVIFLLRARFEHLKLRAWLF